MAGALAASCRPDAASRTSASRESTRRYSGGGVPPLSHLELPTRAEVTTLAAYRGAPAVTMYLSASGAPERSRVTLSALAADAAAAIAELRAPRRASQPLLRALADLAEDHGFWRTAAPCVAVFAHRGLLRVCRLPEPPPGGEALLHVGDTFDLLPMLRCVASPHHAWLLVLGAGPARLFDLSPGRPPEPASVPGLPGGSPPASGSPGLALYARAVDAALRFVLAGRDRPLVLAADEPLASRFRGVCTYPHLLDGEVDGSPTRLSPAALGERAARLLALRHDAEVESLRDLFRLRQALGTATTDLGDVGRAASAGAVEAVIADLDGLQRAGGCAPSSAAANPVAEVLRRAVRAGARIIPARAPADVPGGGPLAAILRGMA